MEWNQNKSKLFDPSLQNRKISTQNSIKQLCVCGGLTSLRGSLLFLFYSSGVPRLRFFHSSADFYKLESLLMEQFCGQEMFIGGCTGQSLLIPMLRDAVCKNFKDATEGHLCFCLPSEKAGTRLCGHVQSKHQLQLPCVMFCNLSLSVL